MQSTNDTSSVVAPLKMNARTRDSVQSRFNHVEIDDIVNAVMHSSEVGYSEHELAGGTWTHIPHKNGEDSWERTAKFREVVKETISALIRGDTLVSYHTNSDDVIKACIYQMAVHGVDVFRIFDGLNFIPNMEHVIQAVQDVAPKVKAETGRDIIPQGTISVGDSPSYTIESYMETARELHKRGIRNFAIKDPCGVVHPDVVFELVSRLKEDFPDSEVHMHSHNSYGLAYAQYMAAIEAGVDAVDVLHPLLADNTAQPDILSVLDMMDHHPDEAIRERGRVTREKLNLDALKKDNEAVARLCTKYRDFEMPFDRERLAAMYKARAPGGASSSLKSMVWGNMQGNPKFPDWPTAERMIYEHEAKITPLCGNVLKVTPQAKTMTTAAAMSLIMEPKDWDEEKDGPYVELTPDLVDLLVGRRGKVAGEIDQRLMERALKKAGLDQPYEGRPADEIKPNRMEKARKRLQIEGEINNPDERDVVTAALAFPNPNEGYHHAVAHHNGELEPVHTARLPDWATAQKISHKARDGSEGKSMFDALEAIGGIVEIERFAQSAFQSERLLMPEGDEYERYMKGENMPPPASGTADLLADTSNRASGDFYTGIYERWATHHRDRIDTFMASIVPNLQKAGFSKMQLAFIVPKIQEILDESCRIKGLHPSRAPKISDYKNDQKIKPGGTTIENAAALTA